MLDNFPHNRTTSVNRVHRYQSQRKVSNSPEGVEIAAKIVAKAHSASSATGDELLMTLMTANNHQARSPLQSVTQPGRFAGVEILQQIQELSSNRDTAQRELTYASTSTFMQVFDSTSLSVSINVRDANVILLPAKEKLLDRIRVVLSRALCVMHFIDCTTLETDIDTLYHLEDNEYTLQERRLLALVYALLAISAQIEINDVTVASSTQDNKFSIRGCVITQEQV